MGYIYIYVYVYGLYRVYDQGCRDCDRHPERLRDVVNLMGPCYTASPQTLNLRMTRKHLSPSI